MLKIHLLMQDIQVQSLGREDSIEKEMVTHSSILAYEIPQTEEAGGLQSMGPQSSPTRLSNLTTTITPGIYKEQLQII